MEIPSGWLAGRLTGGNLPPVEASEGRNQPAISPHTKQPKLAAAATAAAADEDQEDL